MKKIQLVYLFATLPSITELIQCVCEEEPTLGITNNRIILENSLQTYIECRHR